MQPLMSTLHPQAVTLPAIDNALLHEVRLELQTRAAKDPNQCFGYFPALEGRKHIEVNLEACKALAVAYPQVKLTEHNLQFNFLRMSLIQQKGDFPFHLDSDASTAITGDLSTLKQRTIWRLLLNVSAEHPRKLEYLDIDADSVELQYGAGYVHYPHANIPEIFIKACSIPPRTHHEIHGILFCANRVLHTGRDDQHGHFVAAYGAEYTA